MKQQQEIKVIVHGELDVSEMPKDIFDIFVGALLEEIEKIMQEEQLETDNHKF